MVKRLLYPMDNGDVQILKQQKMESWYSVILFFLPHHAEHQNQGLVHARRMLYLWTTSSAMAHC